MIRQENYSDNQKEISQIIESRDNSTLSLPADYQYKNNSSENIKVLLDNIVESDENQSQNANQEIPNFRESRYKYVNSTIYFLTAAISSIAQGTFIPITPIIMRLYGLSNTQVALSILVIYAAMPISNFFTNYFLDNLGLKIGVTIGCLIQILGLGLRLLINHSWNYVILGQILLGIGSTFIQNCPSKVSAAWYMPDNRPTITLIFTFSILISGPIGFIAPCFYVNENSHPSNVDNLLQQQFYIAGGILVANLILFKNKPSHPPSYTTTVKREPFFQAMKLLFKNKSYLCLFTSIGLFLGSINGIVANLALWIYPFGYDQNDTSLIAASLLVFGIIGSVLATMYIKKYRKFKSTIIGCIIMGTILFVLSYVSLEFDNIWITSSIIGFAGFFFFPVISTQIELATEVTFPVGEAMTTGFMFCSGQLMGFLVGYIASLIITGESKTNSFYGLCLAVGFTLLSAFVMIFSKNELTRSNTDLLHMTESLINSATISNDQLNMSDCFMEKNDQQTQYIKIDELNTQIQETIQQKFSETESNVSYCKKPIDETDISTIDNTIISLVQ